MKAPGYAEIHRQMSGLADPTHADVSCRFFKTGPGEYGQGDKFLGSRIPTLRELVRE